MPLKIARNGDNGQGLISSGPIMASGQSFVFDEGKLVSVDGDIVTCILPGTTSASSKLFFIGGKAVTRQTDRIIPFGVMVSDGSSLTFSD